VKLLLSSSSPVYSADLISALKALVSGLTPARPKPWKLCHIVTAGLAGRPDGDRSWMSEPWVAEEERQLRMHGFACDNFDVAGWQDHSLGEHLAGFDVLYIQGGNTFYLLDQLRRSGADKIIRDLVTGDHTVYCGISAGSVVACPDIAVAGWGPEWDHNEVGLTDLAGLGLVPFILSPHYEQKDATLIAARLPLPHPILALEDGQAWVVDGGHQRLIADG
jgi:dipeptidase E